MRLADFQDAFAQALFAPIADAQRSSGAGSAAAAMPRRRKRRRRGRRLAAQPGFAVYRNTVLKGAIDAVEANYPAVTRLVGGEWLRAAAAVFVRAQPPVEPVAVALRRRVRRFPRRLRAGGGHAVARRRRAPRPCVDRGARRRRRATGRSRRAVAALAPAQLARTVLRPHASARWHVAADAPIRTLWRRNRASAADVPDADVGRDLEWRGEGALLTRPRDVVEAVALDAAGAAFLDACAARGTLAEAAAAALAADPATDLARLMATLLGAGAFGTPRDASRIDRGCLHDAQCTTPCRPAVDRRAAPGTGSPTA